MSQLYTPIPNLARPTLARPLMPKPRPLMPKPKPIKPMIFNFFVASLVIDDYFRINTAVEDLAALAAKIHNKLNDIKLTEDFPTQIWFKHGIYDNVLNLSVNTLGLGPKYFALVLRSFFEVIREYPLEKGSGFKVVFNSYPSVSSGKEYYYNIHETTEYGKRIETPKDLGLPPLTNSDIEAIFKEIEDFEKSNEGIFKEIKDSKEDFLKIPFYIKGSDICSDTENISRLGLHDFPYISDEKEYEAEFKGYVPATGE